MSTSAGCARRSTGASNDPCCTRCAAPATSCAMATEERPLDRIMRMSSARLALFYGALVTVLTSILLVSVYLVTRSALEREINSVVRAEVEDLADDLRLGGVGRLGDTLHLRTYSWGRTGEVFLLADEHLRPVAGNLSEWPRDVVPLPSSMIEFEIRARELGAEV